MKRKFSRRDFLKMLGYFSLSSMAVGSGIGVYSTFFEAENLELNEIKINLPRLSPRFFDYRIVQLSDIHMGGWMNRVRLRQVVDLVQTQSADLVVITGDFVFGRSWSESLNIAADEFVSEIKRLAAEIPTLGVLGNHDHWTDARKVRAMLAQSSIIELNNDVYTIERDEDRLHIAGVDDVWEQKARLDIVMSKLPDSAAPILLAHEPDFADESSKEHRFCLQLSGHSHGGQVVLPYLGPPILPYLGRKYPSGLYKVREMWQYTNRGVGMIEPAILLNCRPEITVITLKPA